MCFCILVPSSTSVHPSARCNCGSRRSNTSVIGSYELRPTVAIARCVTLFALALHERPYERQRLQAGQAEEYERFVGEVRQFYPFFPSGSLGANRIQVARFRFPEGEESLARPVRDQP